MAADAHEIKIISSKDCGNAPKKRVLQEFIVACLKKDTDTISEFTSEKLIWTIVNDSTVQGRDSFIHALEGKIPKGVLELELLNVITHGHTAAVNGTLKFKDGTIYSFCNVYRFVSAGKNVLKEITSYVLKND